MNKSLKHEYSNGVENKTIAILGNYPPPLGGVSVHIKRVMHKFEQQGNQVHHFDTSKRNNKCLYVINLIYFLCCSRPEILYYHTVDLNSSFIELRLLLFFKKILNYTVILVEHSCRHLYERSAQKKRLFNRCLQQVDKLVLIGYNTWQSYQDNSIVLPCDTSIEAAFLSPDMRDESAIFYSYPQPLLSFLKKRSPIILMNAFQLSFLNTKDLYGIDVSIEMLALLKHQYPSVGLVCLFSQMGDQDYFLYLQEQIKFLALTNNVYFLIGQQELWPLLKKADLFVRPTLSDGESVSVQEALYFNVPVVASEASQRPRDVVIFKTGNVVDFHRKVVDSLAKKDTLVLAVRENVYE